MCVMCMCGYASLSLSLCVCTSMCMLWRTKADVGSHLQWLFHLTHWGRVSQSNPELAHKAGLSLDSLLWGSSTSALQSWNYRQLLCPPCICVVSGHLNLSSPYVCARSSFSTWAIPQALGFLFESSLARSLKTGNWVRRSGRKKMRFLGPGRWLSQ